MDPSKTVFSYFRDVLGNGDISSAIVFKQCNGNADCYSDTQIQDWLKTHKVVTNLLMFSVLADFSRKTDYFMEQAEEVVRW